MRLLLAALILVLPLHAAAAAVYKWTDKKGNVHYSDKPRPGAKLVEQPPAKPAASPASPAPDAKAAEKSDKTETPPEDAPRLPYGPIAIGKPSAEESIRENSGLLEVEVVVAPKLNVAAGDRFRVTLDGIKLPELQSQTKFSIDNLDRGMHTLFVEVIDTNGKVLSISEPVNFNMLRTTILIPPRERPPVE